MSVVAKYLSIIKTAIQYLAHNNTVIHYANPYRYCDNELGGRGGLGMGLLERAEES